MREAAAGEEAQISREQRTRRLSSLCSLPPSSPPHHRLLLYRHPPLLPYFSSSMPLAQRRPTLLKLTLPHPPLSCLQSSPPTSNNASMNPVTPVNARRDSFRPRASIDSWCSTDSGCSAMSVDSDWSQPQIAILHSVSISMFLASARRAQRHQMIESLPRSVHPFMHCVHCDVTITGSRQYSNPSHHSFRWFRPPSEHPPETRSQRQRREGLRRMASFNQINAADASSSRVYEGEVIATTRRRRGRDPATRRRTFDAREPTI